MAIKFPEKVALQSQKKHDLFFLKFKKDFGKQAVVTLVGFIIL